jgi:hypothetical protein
VNLFGYDLETARPAATPMIVDTTPTQVSVTATACQPSPVPSSQHALRS